MSAHILSTYDEGFHDELFCKKMKYSIFGKTGMRVSKLGFGKTSSLFMPNFV